MFENTKWFLVSSNSDVLFSAAVQPSYMLCYIRYAIRRNHFRISEFQNRFLKILALWYIHSLLVTLYAIQSDNRQLLGNRIPT